MGQHEKSIAALEKLLQDHPRTPFKREVDYTLNLASLGLLDSLRQADKPMELMNAYLRHRPYIQRPNSSDILKLLAWAYEKTGQNDRAARTYRVLISRGLNEPTLALDMARNLMIEDDPQGVINSLDAQELKALKGPDLRRAWSLLGRALARQKQWLPAVTTLEQLIATPGEPPAGAADYAAYGRALWNLGRLAPALAALDRADQLLDKEPGQVAGLERHLLAMDSGTVARQAENYPESEGYFRKAVVLAGSDNQKAQALYELAQSARLAGDAEEVGKVLDQLAKLKVDPWSSMAQRMQTDLDMAPRLAQVGN
jgi:tetratricopeptide (TPR) repeat protein